MQTPKSDHLVLRRVLSLGSMSLNLPHYVLPAKKLGYSYSNIVDGKSTDCRGLGLGCTISSFNVTDFLLLLLPVGV